MRSSLPKSPGYGVVFLTSFRDTTTPRNDDVPRTLKHASRTACLQSSRSLEAGARRVGGSRYMRVSATPQRATARTRAVLVFSNLSVFSPRGVFLLTGVLLAVTARSTVARCSRAAPASATRAAVTAAWKEIPSSSPGGGGVGGAPPSGAS